MKKIIVTGSSGLIGSEVCTYFNNLNFKIFGIDNNQREHFFGLQGNTRWNQKQLEANLKFFNHCELDIRDREKVINKIKEIKPFALIHTAAQPSHDKAAEIPFEDFEINAVGTLNLLEAVRRFSPETIFVHMSTNKVYGDAPNEIKLKELKTRWDFDDQDYMNGISENFRIDQSKHSLFGASKLSSDILVQEYGRYFNIPTACLRGGCLTGPNHSGVELHGFLSYLVKCNIEQNPYTIFGYKGKQVRDNIHSFDVARFIHFFTENPKYGEVYNIGGGKDNTCSILEAFKMVESFTEREMKYTYSEVNRAGDHICYYSDLSKIKQHYPKWNITITLEETIEQIFKSWGKKI